MRQTMPNLNFYVRIQFAVRVKEVSPAQSESSGCLGGVKANVLKIVFH